MTLTYTPTSDSFRGSNCSGTDNTPSRTLILTYPTAVRAGMSVTVNGASLHYGSSMDYTYASGIITFNNVIANTDYIDVNYFVPSQASQTQTQYATTLQVFEYLNLTQEVPNYPISTTLETVDSSGTLASGSIIYLDHGKVIDDTVTLYKGASITSVTALVEGTDYTIDLDKGKITITAAGATNISTNSVFATYKYNELFSDSYVSDLIDRSSAYIDEKCNRFFGDLTLELQEEQSGKGRYQRLYRPLNLNPHVVKTQLNGAVTASATAFTVDSTSGLEDGDYITLEGEVIKIDDVASTTSLTVSRAQLATTAATHADNVYLINCAVELSNTPLGYEPTWTVLGFRDDFDMDSNTGAIQVLHVNPETKDDLATDVFPPQGVQNRIRITYKYGTEVVPDVVTDLCILLTVKKLMNTALSRAHVNGVNGFNPTGYENIDKEIKDLLSEVYLLKSGYV